MQLPQIIQGGMGVGISDWRLARAVAMEGHLGVVSGTVVDLTLVRRLQLGDPGGHLRRALDAFPHPDAARRIVDRFYIAGGKASETPFINKPMVGLRQTREMQELLVASTFVEVYLAKEGHEGLVGINFLEKVHPPMLPSLYGAMLAEVDVVIVGAGIPTEIPGLLDSLARSEAVKLRLHVHGQQPGDTHELTFDPRACVPDAPSTLRRPLFFPVVSSVTLAQMMIKKASGSVDGLIVEGASAGGHNAPPRGKTRLGHDGEPIYGPRDVVDIAAIGALGLPFWLAGSCGSPEHLTAALAAGATGVQVGTLFAFCEESGLRDDLKARALEMVRRGEFKVFTDPLASPTGFPFKVLSLSGTHSEQVEYKRRRRRCDLGYLREAFRRPDGSIDWRCPAEDCSEYTRKGGRLEESIGRKCLCNALTANIGLGQSRQNEGPELPLVTSGTDFSGISRIACDRTGSYAASDVVAFLLSHEGACTQPGFRGSGKVLQEAD